MESNVIKICVSKDGQRLETSDGQALYYYELQSFDALHEGTIPWMANFPAFLVGWMEKWCPLVGKPEFVGNNAPISSKSFSTAERGGNPDEKRQQIMFRNWYLYTYKADTSGTTEGEIPEMWKLVPVDLKPLAEKGFSDQVFNGGP
jgi:hypothetical protein